MQSDVGSYVFIVVNWNVGPISIQNDKKYDKIMPPILLTII